MCSYVSKLLAQEEGNQAAYVAPEELKSGGSSINGTYAVGSNLSGMTSLIVTQMYRDNLCRLFLLYS